MAKTQFLGVFLLALQHLDVREVSYLDVIGILTWIWCENYFAIIRGKCSVLTCGIVLNYWINSCNLRSY